MLLSLIVMLLAMQGGTCLMAAYTPEIVQLLLCGGADASARDDEVRRSCCLSMHDQGQSLVGYAYDHACCCNMMRTANRVPLRSVLVYVSVTAFCGISCSCEGILLTTDTAGSTCSVSGRKRSDTGCICVQCGHW